MNNCHIPHIPYRQTSRSLLLSFLLANPASFAGSRWLGHPSPQRPQRIHADVSSFETTSSLNTKSEELPFTTGTSKLYIAKPIIGPPEMYFSGSPTGPPAAFHKAVCNWFRAIHRSYPVLLRRHLLRLQFSLSAAFLR